MYKTHFLEAKNSIQKPLQQRIESIVQEVYEDIHTTLNCEECEIVVTPHTNKILLGEMFQTFPYDENTVYLAVDGEAIVNRLDELSVVQALKEKLYAGIYITARVRALRLDAECGLLEEIVEEGLAAHFVVEVTEEKPHKRYTSIKDVDRLLKQVRQECKEGNIDSEKWYVGSTKENIPPDAAYAVGFYIVNNYREKTKRTSVEAIAVSAKEITALSQIDLTQYANS